MKKRLIFGSIVVVIMVSLMGCSMAISPDVYRPPYYGGPYNGYRYGWGYGYGWSSGPTRWVPGYQRWVCEGPPGNLRCYWTWEPGHYE